MNLEELKQIIFLSEHGYYDKEVVKLANENKSENIDRFYLYDGVVVAVHSGGVEGFYGVDNMKIGRGMLSEFRKEYIIKTFPEIKKLVEEGE